MRSAISKQKPSMWWSSIGSFHPLAHAGWSFASTSENSHQLWACCLPPQKRRLGIACSPSRRALTTTSSNLSIAKNYWPAYRRLLDAPPEEFLCHGQSPSQKSLSAAKDLAPTKPA